MDTKNPTKLSFEICREEGDGAVLSIDWNGHLNPSQGEEALWLIEASPEEFGFDYDDQHCLSIKHSWRYASHLEGCSSDTGEDCDCDYLAWEYSNTPTPDSVPVTQFLVGDWGWDRPHCHYHPHRPSQAGLPEYLWPEEIDSDKVAGEFLYVCWKCRDQVYRRHRQRMDCYLESVKRLESHGLRFLTSTQVAGS